MPAYGDPTRPYAATEATGTGGETYSYDAAGNADRVGDLHIRYTLDNLPRPQCPEQPMAKAPP